MHLTLIGDFEEFARVNLISVMTPMWRSVGFWWKNVYQKFRMVWLLDLGRF